MVPIHDTDIAAERWTQAEWENYELWEKVEVRLKRRKQLWILGTVILFLMISAVPIVRDQMPRWRAMSAVRHLAQEINRVKREANTEHASFRIRFKGNGSLMYQVEKVATCSEPSGSVVRTGELLKDPQAGQYTLLNSTRGLQVDIPGLSESFCYDFLAGSEAILRGASVEGFAVMPESDLLANRMDRLALVVISGTSAEVAFE